MHAGFFAPCSICDVIKPRLRPYPRPSLRSRTPKNSVTSRSLAEFASADAKKFQSFSSATCAAEKIPLGSQTCATRALQRAAVFFRRESSEAILGGACAAGARKNPAAEAAGGVQLVQKPRRVSPPKRRKKVRSFSSATCAAKKILLGLQTCELSVSADSECDAVRPQTPLSKK